MWASRWAALVTEQGTELVTSQEGYFKILSTSHASEYVGWSRRTDTVLQGLVTYESTTLDGQTAKDGKIESGLLSIYNDFAATFGGATDLQASAKDYATDLASYTTAKKSITDTINKSFIASFEYTFTNQSSVQLPKSTTQTYAIGTTAPDLSNFNVILAGPISPNGGVQLTANGSVTLFAFPAAQLALSPIRDFKVAAEVDFPIPQFVGLAKSTLSVSGLVQDLLQEPLGQKVMVNGVSVTNAGNIVLGQVKWSVPVGTSGVVIPISITSSNRTDLIKETDVKGTFGISYNFDSLFSKQ